jgi:intracellular multiplication protein IcmT
MARAIEDTEIERANWHWRNSMRPVRFFNLDARAALPFFVLLVYFRPITLFLTIVITTAFYFLERRGLTFPSALRALRVWLIGYNRPGWLGLRHRRMRDFG